MESEKIEQTLYQCRNVQVYRIPPRPSSGTKTCEDDHVYEYSLKYGNTDPPCPPGGHKSGDWKVGDRIFEGRLRVMSIGNMCELRLEEPGRCCKTSCC